VQIEYIITRCPTDACKECSGCYSNSLINCRIICRCKCHGTNPKNVEERTLLQRKRVTKLIRLWRRYDKPEQHKKNH
jgi:hypothetical protein